MPHLVDQLPARICRAVGFPEFACGFEMLGDERGMLRSRVRFCVFRSQRPPVGASSARSDFELGLVCHRAYQRMMERILRVLGEPHLVDQFSRHELLDGGVCRPNLVRRSALKRNPITAAALRVRFAPLG